MTLYECRGRFPDAATAIAAEPASDSFLAFHSARALVGTPSIPKISMSYPSRPGRVFVSLCISQVFQAIYSRFRLAFVYLLTMDHQTTGGLRAGSANYQQTNEPTFSFLGHI